MTWVGLVFIFQIPSPAPMSVSVKSLKSSAKSLNVSSRGSCPVDSYLGEKRARGLDSKLFSNASEEGEWHVGEREGDVLGRDSGLSDSM